jgi:hypothetical protein
MSQLISGMLPVTCFYLVFNDGNIKEGLLKSYIGRLEVKTKVINFQHVMSVVQKNCKLDPC